MLHERCWKAFALELHTIQAMKWSRKVKYTMTSCAGCKENHKACATLYAAYAMSMGPASRIELHLIV